MTDQFALISQFFVRMLSLLAAFASITIVLLVLLLLHMFSSLTAQTVKTSKPQRLSIYCDLIFLGATIEKYPEGLCLHQRHYAVNVFFRNMLRTSLQGRELYLNSQTRSTLTVHHINSTCIHKTVITLTVNGMNEIMLSECSFDKDLLATRTSHSSDSDVTWISLWLEVRSSTTNV